MSDELHIKKIEAHIPISCCQATDAGLPGGCDGHVAAGDYLAQYIAAQGRWWRLRVWCSRRWWALREGIGHRLCGCDHSEDDW